VAEDECRVAAVLPDIFCRMSSQLTTDAPMMSTRMDAPEEIAGVHD
jgi:hypothetical protein